MMLIEVCQPPKVVGRIKWINEYIKKHLTQYLTYTKCCINISYFDCILPSSPSTSTHGFIQKHTQKTQSDFSFLSFTIRLKTEAGKTKIVLKGIAALPQWVLPPCFSSSPTIACTPSTVQISPSGIQWNHKQTHLFQNAVIPQKANP